MNWGAWGILAAVLLMLFVIIAYLFIKNDNLTRTNDALSRSLKKTQAYNVKHGNAGRAHDEKARPTNLAETQVFSANEIANSGPREIRTHNARKPRPR